MLRVMPLILALVFPLPAHAWPATLLDVHDGDTVTVAPMGDLRAPMKVRLYGIDAPELGQRGGQRSRDCLRSLVQPGQDVEVIPMGVDQYSRVVGLLATERVLNVDMLEAGEAWVFPPYCKAAFCKGWLKIERQAKAEKRGLWQDKRPTPPWKWRKKK